MSTGIDEPNDGTIAPTDDATVLIVDDSQSACQFLGKIIEQVAGMKPIYAPDARQALWLMERAIPAVVLTDLVMPEMDGLALVQEIRARYPSVPVIVVTAHGSESTVVLALRAGAASYVPKSALERDLLNTIQDVLHIASVSRTRQRVLSSLVGRESHFVLENDPELITPLIDVFLQELSAIAMGDQAVHMRIGVALREALSNALYHGNLEISSDLREDDDREFYALATKRRHEAPYDSRRIDVRASINQREASFVIRDDGPGFDVASLDRPLSPEDLLRIGGRGMLLIKTFMDETLHNGRGNEITLVKRPANPPETKG